MQLAVFFRPLRVLSLVFFPLPYHSEHPFGIESFRLLFLVAVLAFDARGITGCTLVSTLRACGDYQSSHCRTTSFIRY